VHLGFWRWATHAYVKCAICRYHLLFLSTSSPFYRFPLALEGHHTATFPLPRKWQKPGEPGRGRWIQACPTARRPTPLAYFFTCSHSFSSQCSAFYTAPGQRASKGTSAVCACGYGKEVIICSPQLASLQNISYQFLRCARLCSNSGDW
jgi:hypothetical protein